MVLFLEYGIFPGLSLPTQIWDQSLAIWHEIILSRVFVDFNVYHKLFGEMIEAYLRRGADSNLELYIPEESCAEIMEKISVGKLFRNTFDFEVRTGNNVYEASKRRSIIRVTREFHFIFKRGGKASLRDLIEFWAFENEEAILRMMDKNLQQLELEPTTMPQDEQEQAEESSTMQPLERITPKPKDPSQLQLEFDSTEDKQQKEAGKFEVVISELARVSKPPTGLFDLLQGWMTLLAAFFSGILVAVLLPRLMNFWNGDVIW
ncbi:uncharacterized protein LY89DRAFT_774366 [Mollisia scopiformis]|uniref:Uncharacterized protein n=1 Tax=Mollisia scopiformis TaxID=149040 RepID=A0A194XEF0_MOLSC|nr:uncharacterized protein LY89DRAFT_774366 [Mollisia scopiformis]KUJ18521.1 hypothetical protein LY89DRAFT_774366 [Mollisia scopiformis]